MAMDILKPPVERIERAGEVFYSIWSAYEKEVLHIAPEQLLELRAWLNANEASIRQDAETKEDR